MPLRKKKTLHIRGMTCTQCEKIIHKALMAERGVQEASVSFENGVVQMIYDSEQIDESDLIQVIHNIGYDVVLDEHSESKKSAISPLQFAGIAVIVAALYLIIDRTVGFNFIPTVQPSTSYGMLFLVGLLTSVHCIAMCGGINLSQCIIHNTEGSSSGAWKPSLLYNSGRVVAYTILGGIIGGLGTILSFSGSSKGWIAIFAGIFMVIMGVNMIGFVPGLRRLNIKMPTAIRERFKVRFGENRPFVVGLLNGLMPCGPLQAMQLYALGTGSVVAGALSMFAFSLGTVPLMFGFGAISTLISKRFTHSMLRVSAILVIFLGIIMMQRGINLSGINVLQQNPLDNLTSQASTIARVVNGVQVVKGEVSSDAYPEITVQKGIPVQFNLHADSKNLNGCNNSIVIQELNIQKKLEPGDNIITFTPTQTGTLKLSCWMGMISSDINVVDSIRK